MLVLAVTLCLSGCAAADVLKCCFGAPDSDARTMHEYGGAHNEAAPGS
jgi:hypothetical protein